MIIIFNLKKTTQENNQERHLKGHCVCGIYYCVLFRENPWRKSSFPEPLPLPPVLITRPLSPTGNGCGSLWIAACKSCKLEGSGWAHSGDSPCGVPQADTSGRKRY